MHRQSAFLSHRLELQHQLPYPTMKSLPLMLLSYSTTWNVVQSLSTVTPTKSIKAPQVTVETTDDSSSIASRWKNKNYIESNGNYEDDAFLEDRSTPLYEHQSSFQQLPIPSLEETLKRLTPTVVPLAKNDKERDSWSDACKAFLEEAQFLQERLEERRTRTTNWIQEWWNVDCYLADRNPLVTFSSYCFHLPLPSNVEMTNIQLAASCLQATAEFAQSVKTGSKVPDAMGRNGQKLLCSAPYKYMFHSSRIPKQHQDVYRTYNPFSNSHVIVACRGHFYKVPVQDDKTGEVFSKRTLESLLMECVTQSIVQAQEDDVFDLGYLTSLPRNEWASVRSDMEEMGFESALEEMDSAMLVLNLDVGDGENKASKSWRENILEYWHGGGSDRFSNNRWYDNSINLIVTPDAKLGLVGEHTMMDGLPVAVFSEFLIDKVTKEKEESDCSPRDLGFNKVVPVTNVFQEACESLTQKQQKELLHHVGQARSDFEALASRYDLEILHHTDYGEDFIKKAGFSPDAFCQMAMQLASYRLYGVPVSTYESTQVRIFYQGRTETTRTVSLSSAEFVKAMSDESIPKEKKLQLLKKAAYAHSKYSSKAAKGLGVDRHLFGLAKCLEDGERRPALFDHPLYHRSKEWQLSTSQLSTVTPAFGIATDNGLGIGYTIHVDELIFFVTGLVNARLVDNMCRLTSEALDEMKQLIDDTSMDTVVNGQKHTAN